MKKLLPFIIGLSALLAGPAAAQQPAPTPDSQGAAGILLVGNKGENSVSFIDLASGRELGRVPTGPMPHEIAVSPDGRQAAVVNYGASSIDIIDVAGRAPVRRIDLSPNAGPHGLVWLPDGRILATTERSQSLTIVDTNADDRVSAISTGQQGTHMVAVSPDHARAYTANIPAGTVSVLDLTTGAKVRDIQIGGHPEGLALTPDGRTLWVGDNQGARVTAWDTQSFERLAEVTTGQVPIRVAASPDGRWVLTSNAGSGTITVIDAATRQAVRTIPVSGSGQAAQVTMIFSPDGARIYAAETARNQVAEVDLATGQVLRRLPAGAQGDGLAVVPPPR